MPDLSGLRARIDRIDDKIVDLLGERFKIVDEVINEKRQRAIPVRLAGRIEEVKQRNELRARELGIPADLVRALYGHIIEATCLYEESALVRVPEQLPPAPDPDCHGQ